MCVRRVLLEHECVVRGGGLDAAAASARRGAARPVSARAGAARSRRSARGARRRAACGSPARRAGGRGTPGRGPARASIEPRGIHSVPAGLLRGKSSRHAGKVVDGRGSGGLLNAWYVPAPAGSSRHGIRSLEIRRMARPRFLLCLAVLSALILPVRAVPAGAFTVQPGIAFIAIHDATVGNEFVLADKRGHELGRGNADTFGSLIFRRLPQGARLVLTETGGAGPQEVRVARFKDHPDESFYARPGARRGVPVHRDARRHAALRDGAARRSSRAGGRSVSDRRRVLRLLRGRSEQPAALDADRAGARLRDRRGQHARLGLLGRRHRPLRSPDHGRRLRRHRDGRRAVLGEGRQRRHGRDLVPGHQPGLRRRARGRRTSRRSRRSR